MAVVVCSTRDDMATCSKCNFVMDAMRPAPTRCPRCGTPVGASRGVGGPPSVDLDDLGVGAPPAFAGEGQFNVSSAGSTLFGMLPDDSLEAPVMRSSPSDSGGISLGELDDNFGELDLPMPGPDGSVELDLPTSSRATPAPFSAPSVRGAPPAPPRAPLPPRAPGPTAAVPSPPAARPPAPPRPGPPGTTAAVPAAGTRGAPVPPPRPTPGPVLPVHPRPAVGTVPIPPAAVPATDLPTPVHRSTAMTFKVPTVDLPTPARPSSSGFRAPEPPPFQGGGSTGSTPLVTSADHGMISIGDLDLPSPIEDNLPTPASMTNLPTPAGSNLPTPVGMNLLAPLEVDLPIPSAGGLLTPAALDVEPAHILPTPADQAMAPADQALMPAGARRPGAGPGEDAAPQPFGLDPALARRSPAPRDVSVGGARRPLLLAGGGIALLAAIGGGAWAMGVFDPPPDVPVTSTKRADGKGADGKAQGKTPAPPSVAVERSAEVMGLLAADTPASYVAAIAAAEKTGDLVGQAEAALCMHLRYGPDALRQGQATTWLQPYATQTEPFVRRVVGLAQLGAGGLAAAEAALVDDTPRTRLYRGWLRLAQARPAEALSEADTVLAAAPNELSAIALRHEARAAAKDPDAEISAVEASVVAHPGHPGLTATAVRVAIAAGQLRKARTWLDGLAPSPEAGSGFEAMRLRLRAQLEEAAGSAAKAARLYEAAAVLVASDRSLGIARVRALAKAGRLAEASSAIAKLVAAKPDDVDGVLLQIEVLLEAGEGDKALELVTAVEKQWPGRADTAVMLGRVHAMRLQTLEARTAFASALARDSANVVASIYEAQLLVRLDQLGDALAVLDTARKRAADAGARAKEAQVLRAKAEILAKAGQQTAALAALDQALAATPTDNAALLGRGLMRIEAGQADAGKADLLAVYERTGAFVGLTAPLGRIFVREGAIDKLEALVGDGLDDVDADTETLIVGARLRLAQGDTDGAKAALAKVLAITPNDWEAHLLLAQALMDAKEYAEALAQIDRSMPSSPSAEKQLLRGKILEYNARHAEARPEYLKALQIDPTLVEARFLYGRLAARAGEAKLAAEQLLVVTTATDRFPEAFVELGRAQRDIGEGSNAIATLTRAIELDPKLLEAQYLRGRAYFETNAMGKAADSLAAAAVESSASEHWYADALLFLGRARAKEGKRKEALAAFETFLKVAPETHSGRADAARQVAELR
jgi:tetratricopeptide (TPR) repeat protein